MKNRWGRRFRLPTFFIHLPAEYRKQASRFEELLSFDSEADRARIRGGNALAVPS